MGRPNWRDPVGQHPSLALKELLAQGLALLCSLLAMDQTGASPAHWLRHRRLSAAHFLRHCRHRMSSATFTPSLIDGRGSVMPSCPRTASLVADRSSSPRVSLRSPSRYSWLGNGRHSAALSWMNVTIASCRDGSSSEASCDCAQTIPAFTRTTRTRTNPERATGSFFIAWQVYCKVGGGFITPGTRWSAVWGAGTRSVTGGLTQ